MRPLFCLLALVWLVGCSKADDRLETYTGDEIDNLRYENLKADNLKGLNLALPRNDSILLGFRLEMTKEDYYKHIDSLLQQNILHRFNESDFAYTFKEDSIRVEAQFLPGFSNNKLVQLKLVLWDDTNFGGSILVKNFLEPEYGEAYFSARSQSDIYLKRGVEVEVKREKIQPAPDLSASIHDVVTYRLTHTAMLSRL